jgi:hypothetical protein
MALGTALTAALTYFGARNKNRAAAAQQQQDNQQKQAQQQTENKRLADEDAWRRQYEGATLAADKERTNADVVSKGIDPTTGQPKPLPALPSADTKGVANSTKGTLQQQFQHAQAIARVYAADPSPQSQDTAHAWLQTAANLGNQIRQQQQIEAQTKRTQEEGAARAAQEKRREAFEMSEHGAPTYRDLHPLARGGGRGRESDQPADSDSISKATDAISKSPNPRATAAMAKAAAIAHGANSRTIQTIDAIGVYYDNKKFPQKASSPGSSIFNSGSQGNP